MNRLFVLVAAGAFAFPSSDPLLAQANEGFDLREWTVEWGGRTRDPFVAQDGKVWFVGQQGNYIAYFDPTTEQFRRYEIEEGTNPHNLIVDEQGYVWYAGNRNGRIGRLDPATGELQIHMMPDPNVRDPHTLIFDGKGNIWFTAQGSNRIGRLNMETGHIDLIVPNEQPSNPYGIVMDAEGNPWVSLFRTNTLVRVDPETLAVTRFEKADEASRSRRIEWTEDGMAWYVDEPRGFLGRISPETGEVTEWQTPGGPGSRPYALTKDDQGRLWFSETGPVKQLIGFDPRTEEFFSVNSVSHNIRHMMFHPETGTMWFGTDANNIGRIVVRRPLTD
jgi:virginiamycin B lyase